MKLVIFSCILLSMAGYSLGQTRPSHIESPTYPPAALAARVQSKVILNVTINGDGKVTNVEPAGDAAHQPAPVLLKAAMENLRRWTFERPASQPATQEFVYQYKFDSALPLNDNHNPIVKVVIDLPNHVTVLANEQAINPAETKREN